jgi:hypothetical protein
MSNAMRSRSTVLYLTMVNEEICVLRVLSLELSYNTDLLILARAHDAPTIDGNLRLLGFLMSYLKID